MAINVEWYSDAAVLVTYTASITAHDQHLATLQFIAYLDAASQPLNVIADWRNANNYPIDFDIVPDVLKMLRHKNMGWIVVIGMNNVLRFWAEMFTRIAGLRYATCNAVEEAAEFLALREQERTA